MKKQFSEFIINIAPQYGVTATPIDKNWRFFTLEKNGKNYLFYNGVLSDTTPASSSRLVRNKYYTNIYLKELGYPVLPQIWTNNFTEIKTFLKTNKSVVVKPPSKEGGVGVSVNINNSKDLKNTLQKVLKITKKPIIEKYFKGEDIRVTVIYDKVFAVQRYKPFILGDGKKTILELIKEKNKTKDIKKGQKHIRINSDLVYFLKKQKLNLKSKPTKNKKIILSGIGNLSYGGDSEVITTQLSKEIKSEAIKIAKQLKLNILGIDYIVRGEKRYINELNATPGFRLHEFPTIGKGENITKVFFDELFGKTKEKSFEINSFEDYKKIEKEKINSSSSFLAFGVTAFMRFFPSFFVNNFKVYCFKNSTDNEILENYTKIFSLKKIKPNIKLKFTNTNNLLINKYITQDISRVIGEKNLFVYKVNKNIEKAINDMNINKVVAASSKLNKMFENKDSFRKVMEKINLKRIKGINITFKQFQKMTFKEITKKVGFPFVIQMPDFLLGGGKGTLFIHSKEDYEKYISKTKNGKYKGKFLKRVILTKFIKGESCSVQCCATKYGVFVTNINTQIMDIPQVIQTKKGSGLFVGHVFGRKYSKKTQDSAKKLAKKVGKYMYSQGYKGIFGMDLIIEEGTNEVYPIEVNARYTGAFPMISMLQRNNKIVPLDIFHFLEQLNIPYKTNFNKIQKLYNKNVSGSHIIISNHYKVGRIAIRTMKAGLYEWDNKLKKAKFIKATLNYSDIKNSNQFIICDGTPRKGDIVKRYTSVARISHLLFSDDIITKTGKLKAKQKAMIKYIYKYIFGANYR